VRENFSLLYTISKVRENKLANETIVHIYKDREQCSNIEISIPNNIPILQGEGIAINNMNMYTLQDFKTTTIPYKDN